MANSKVQLADGSVLIDLTSDTVTAAALRSGYTAHDAAGNPVNGALEVDTVYSVTKTLTNVTSSNDDTKVIAGGSFYANLTPTSGYSITNVTVTMGGVDVTDQVFKPGVGGKGITANGIYSASDDALSGYDRVVVNVALALDQKTITENGTYEASNDALDGYSSVIVALALDQKTITENGTYEASNDALDGYSSVIVDVPTGGYSVDDIAATGITGNVELTVSSVRDYGFRGQPLTSVAGNNVTRVGRYAFGQCTSLNAISFPNLTSFGYGAFLGSGLKTASFDSLVSIANGNDGTYAFQECRSLEMVRFPKLETIGTGNKYMFYNAGTSSSYKLVAVLPKIKNLGTRTFDRSYAKVIDIGPDLTALTGADVFYCSGETASVQTLILRYTGGVVTTANTDRIKGLRAVYVPQALISSYQSAANWSTRVNAGKITFYAIEGSVYENAYADGTPIE